MMALQVRFFGSKRFGRALRSAIARRQDLDFFGIFAPDFRASFRAIATACFRLVTFLPLPDFSVPSLCSCITFLTLLRPADVDFFVAMFPALSLSRKVRTSNSPSVRFRPAPSAVSRRRDAGHESLRPGRPVPEEVAMMAHRPGVDHEMGRRNCAKYSARERSPHNSFPVPWPAPQNASQTVRRRP